MYQLDTPIVSEYIKKRPARKIIEWLDSQNEHSLFVSCLTIAELQKGLHKLESKAQSQDERRRASRIKDWIQMIVERFEGRILPVDSDVLATWAKVCGISEATGVTLPVIDSLMAASALVSNLSLVTTNEQDFRRCSQSLEIINPLAVLP